MKNKQNYCCQIACGFRHGIIVDRDNGFIYAFGYGGNGELAQGSILKDTPTVLHPDFTSNGNVELSCRTTYTCNLSTILLAATTLHNGWYSDDGNSKNNNNSNNDDDDDDNNERNVLFSWGRVSGQLVLLGFQLVPQQITLLCLEDDGDCKIA